MLVFSIGQIPEPVLECVRKYFFNNLLKVVRRFSPAKRHQKTRTLVPEVKKAWMGLSSSAFRREPFDLQLVWRRSLLRRVLPGALRVGKVRMGNLGMQPMRAYSVRSQVRTLFATPSLRRIESIAGVMMSRLPSIRNGRGCVDPTYGGIHATDG